MNFTEGIKRIYLILSFLVLAASAFIFYDDRPTEKKLLANTVNAMKDAIAARNNGVYIDISRRTDGVFVEEICSSPNRFEEVVDLCNRHKFEKIEMPRALIYHAIYSTIMLLLVSFCAFLLWFLINWVINGFKYEKNSN